MNEEPEVSDGSEPPERDRLLPPVVPPLPAPHVTGTFAPPPPAMPQHLADPQVGANPSPVQHAADPQVGAGHNPAPLQHTAEPQVGSAAQNQGSVHSESTAHSVRGGEHGAAKPHASVEKAATRRGLRWGERGARFKIGVIGGGIAAAAVVTAAAVSLANRNDGSAAQQPAVVVAAPDTTVAQETPATTGAPATTVVPDTTVAPEPIDTTKVASIPVDWDPPSSGATVDEAVAAAAFTGFWTGDWGNQVFQISDDGQVVSVYEHDEGIVVGQLEDGVINGWWCEVPSHMPPNDAGAVQLRIIDDGSGNFSIDGRWQFGYDATVAWNENWDISTKGDAPSPDLTARLATAASLCQQPAG